MAEVLCYICDCRAETVYCKECYDQKVNALLQDEIDELTGDVARLEEKIEELESKGVEHGTVEALEKGTEE